MLKKLKENELIKVLAFMKKRMPLYLGLLVVKNAVTSVCFNIVIAFIVKDVFDAVLKGQEALFTRAIILAASTFIIGCIINPIASYLGNLCVKETMKEIRIKAFEKLESLTIESFEKDHSGNFISIVTNDINNIESIYSDQMNLLVFAIIYGVVSIASMLLLEWRIAIVVVVLGIITVIINNSFSTKIRALNDNMQLKMGKMTEKLIDLIQSTPITKVFGLKKWVQGFYAKENSDYTKTSMKLNKLESFFDVVNSFLGSLKYIGVLCLSFFMIYKGYITAGTAMAIMQLMGNASYMFDNIGVFIKNIQKSLSGASRVEKLLLMDSEEENRSKKWEPDKESINIAEFNDVTFAYNREDNSLVLSLSNVNLKFKRGEVTAIVGSSGSGKSTMAKLLLGFYKPLSGNIKVEGNDIVEYSSMTTRERIAYVMQSSYLFYGTIEENIGYGKLGSSKEKIISAAKAANAHDFIMSLPNGYETMVEERGDNLSGGQKQRIAIARALLREAPILLLDEATSSLDSESERQIYEKLENSTKNLTTIVIAHKLSTIKNADLIYVLDKGKVVQEGNHDELIMKNGVYKNLYETQNQINNELVG